jgi:hypothetical protein
MGDLSEELSGGCYSVKTKPPKTLLPDSSIGNIALHASERTAPGNRRTTRFGDRAYGHSTTLEIIFEITRLMRSIWRTPIWLVAHEQTILRCFGWYFNFDYHYMNAGILWGTGWAMVLLALVLAIRLPSIGICQWLLARSGGPIATPGQPGSLNSATSG